MAATYSILLLRRPPSALRTAVKVLPVCLLGAASVLDGAPWLLLAGLALSALGDGFLAGEEDWRLKAGIAAFLGAQIAYAVLFYLLPDMAGRSRVFPPLPRLVSTIAAALAALGMYAWLWPRLGALRIPVTIYVAAIYAMVAAALALPPGLAPDAPRGAALFFASDAILAAQLFRGRFDGAVGHQAVWWFYYLGQLGIVHGVIGSLFR